ncbi:hypothetical protein K432DRAFT_423264 [Lepidopterella palustris CBS 459.81]|uniref:Ankyrin n=1 Tax=Lepidopterella palustris CBS 459.81 TaxID=1314670 RepID=A0A8E2EGJ1_9PEZI|nr:hypothetical protein K432DRAFT_423264 [Lepidopterella palustris CBS 459.81]
MSSSNSRVTIKPSASFSDTCEWADLASTTALLNSGADPNSNYGEAVWLSVTDHNLPLLALLLARGATPNAQDLWPQNAAATAPPTPCPTNAVSAPTASSSTLPVRNSSDSAWVAYQARHYGSPLQLACLLGQLDTGRLLLSKGADANCQLGSFGTPLRIARWHGDVAKFRRQEITNLLMRYGGVDEEGECKGKLWWGGGEIITMNGVVIGKRIEYRDSKLS